MGELTYEHVLELFARTDKKFEKTNKKFEESDRRFEDRLIKSSEEFAKMMAQTNKKIAELGDTLGRFAEEQVRADLINKFDSWGIPVHAITNHFIQSGESNEFLYEVDILIYNSDYVIAIEVKNTLKTDHVNEHLDRLEKIQAHPMVGLSGKKLLGGVAAMIVGEGVEKYAESKGLFVLKPSGDTVKIVNNKRTFKPREWIVN